MKLDRIRKGIGFLEREGIQNAWQRMRYDLQFQHIYKRWMIETEAQRIDAICRQWGDRKSPQSGPLISVLMPVYDPDPRWLVRAIGSVRNQLYQKWELCIADDGSCNPAIRTIIEEAMSMDSRIVAVWRPMRGHISEASNSALKLATGEYVALLDHDDELAKQALACIAEVIRAKPEVKIIYSDEDKIDDSGSRHTPYFKPDWNAALLESQNYINHLCVYNTHLIRDANGFRKGFEGSQDWDLLLRSTDMVAKESIHHIAEVLYHWRITPDSTASTTRQKSYANKAGATALLEHSERREVFGDVVSGPGGSFLLKPICKTTAKVTILVCGATDQACRRAHELAKNSGWDALEMLFLDRSHIGVGDAKDEWHRLWNLARSAQGEYLVLLPPWIESARQGWLKEMLSSVQFPGTGAVGGMILCGQKIHHTGVLTGLDDKDNPELVYPYQHCKSGTPGYMNQALLAQHFPGLRGVLLMQKSHLPKVEFLSNYFDSPYRDLSVTFTLHESGLNNRYAPAAVFFASEGMPESASSLRRLAESYPLFFDSPATTNPNLRWRKGLPFPRVVT